MISGFMLMSTLLVAQQQNNNQRGIFESFAIVNSPAVNNGNDQFYDLNANTSNPNFQGANLGSIQVGQTIRVVGGQQKTYKNSGCDISSGDLFYRIGNNGPFTEVDLNFEFNIGNSGDQQWGRYNFNADISSSLAPGTYTLQIFTRAQVQFCFNGNNNGDIFTSNNSNNYIATFTILQPIDCVLSNWSDWSPVNDQCGITYTQTRTRTVTTQPANGGAACGPLQETRSVTNDACPIDCVLSDWSEWAPVDATCGITYTQTRTRTIDTAPANGGAACGDLEETREVSNNACPIDCVLSNWSEWAPVNATCGITYTQTRTRTIDTAPANGGSACGPLQETRSVTNDACPIDCVLSDWSEWSPVNDACGITYTQTRTRTVTTQPANGGAACGELMETQDVTNDPCEQNCEPVLTAGGATGIIYNAIECRWKGLNNTSGANTALYLGNANMGSGGINRVQVGRNGLYTKPGSTPISFVYNPALNNLVATVGSRSVTYTNVSAKATGDITNMNVMNIMMRSGNGLNNGVLTLTNIELNGYPLPDISQPAASTGFWNISNVNFSAGFTLEATIMLTSGTYGSNENSKVDIWVGNNNSAVPNCEPQAMIISQSETNEAQTMASFYEVLSENPTMLIGSRNQEGRQGALLLNNPSGIGQESVVQFAETKQSAARNLRVFDISGREVQSAVIGGDVNLFGLGSEYPVGMYLIEILHGEDRQVLKLIKQ